MGVRCYSTRARTVGRHKRLIIYFKNTFVRILLDFFFVSVIQNKIETVLLESEKNLREEQFIPKHIDGSALRRRVAPAEQSDVRTISYPLTFECLTNATFSFKCSNLAMFGQHDPSL